MNSNDSLIKLKYSLQALAQPARIQTSLFPEFVQIADELAIEFNHWHSVVSQNEVELTNTQKKLLFTLDNYLLEMSSGALKKELWTIDALQKRIEWKKVRNFAKRILKEFNWEINRPPLDRNHYINQEN